MCATQRLSSETRKKEIMTAAAKIIIAKGFENTTMEEIIAGTTLSKGGVYHYYKNTVDIFKDLMLAGIDYRVKVIKNNLPSPAESKHRYEFIAQQMVEKILDDNFYMPLYVEFLLAKKRNPQLETVFKELQNQTLDTMLPIFPEVKLIFAQPKIFDLITNFINAMILVANVLDARENLHANRQILQKMIIIILESEADK